MEPKIILWNLCFMQSNGWSLYHGGGENDYTVLVKLLEKIGNHQEWLIYGYYIENRKFVRDIQPLLDEYHNFELINKKTLLSRKEHLYFHCVTVSNIHGLKWLLKHQLSCLQSVVTVHGLRRYEMVVSAKDFLLPSKLYEKLFLALKFFMPKYVNMLLQFRYRSLLNRLPTNTNLVAISNDTRQKLLAISPNLSSTQVQILYTSNKSKSNESTKEAEQEALLLKQYGVRSKGYILLLSLGRIEKNGYFALEHLKQLIDEHHLPLTILACGEAKENIWTRRFKNAKNIQILGYLPTDILTVLYKHAFLLIYPTRTEGFGMPILEAMEQGTPVCCSALSPLIEVGGQAAEYFNLKNGLELRSKVLRFYQDKEYYIEKSKQSVERYHLMQEMQQRDLEQKIRMFVGNTPIVRINGAN